MTAEVWVEPNGLRGEAIQLEHVKNPYSEPIEALSAAIAQPTSTNVEIGKAVRSLIVEHSGRFTMDSDSLVNQLIGWLRFAANDRTGA